jgi:hypothetical protein
MVKKTAVSNQTAERLIGMGLRIYNLRVGGRYLHHNGNFIRTIDSIVGNTIYWHDECGPGDCTRNVFLKRCQGFALDETGNTQTLKPEEAPMTPEEKAQAQELRRLLGTLAGITFGMMQRVNILTQALLPWDQTLTADQKANIMADLKAELADAEHLREEVGKLADQ